MGGYSSAGGRAGPGRGGGAGRLLAVTGAGAEGGRLDSVDPKVGSESAWAPEDEDGVATILRPTSVLNPRVVSKLSDDPGSGASDMSLDDILTLKNYCVSWVVLAAAALLLDFLCIKMFSIISKFSSICFA